MSECLPYEHEAWKSKLAHAFKDLKEADNDRDTRLRHNEEVARRIILDVFQPVLSQFVVDAKDYGFNAELTSQPGGRYKLHLHCPPSSPIEFWTEATPDAVRVFTKVATSPYPTLIPQTNDLEPFQKSDLAGCLVAQLKAITPKS